MKIVIFGGCGFIGSNVADALLNDRHHVVLFDNLSRENVIKNYLWLLSNHPKVKLLRQDIEDPYAVRRAVEIVDVVLHFAAQTAVTTSIVDPRHDFEVNALGTFNVLEGVRLSGNQPLVIYASTNKVYGDFKTEVPVSELQPLLFSTPYGCSKGAGDQYMLDYNQTYGIPTVVLRMSCQYGPHQYGVVDQGWVSHFAQMVLSGNPITIYGDGSQVRDILYISDYVELIRVLIAKKEIVAGEIFNIGGGMDYSIRIQEGIKLMDDLLGKTTLLDYADWRVGDQRYYVSSIDKIKQLTGWYPTVPPRQGIEKLLTWTKNQK